MQDDMIDSVADLLIDPVIDASDVGPIRDMAGILVDLKIFGHDN